MLATLCLCSENSDFFVPKDSPGQIAKLQLNTMGCNEQATYHILFAFLCSTILSSKMSKYYQIGLTGVDGISSKDIVSLKSVLGGAF